VPNYPALWKEHRWTLWLLVPMLAWGIFYALSTEGSISARLVTLPVTLLLMGRVLFYWWKSRESAKPGLPIRG
jgi:hypothetical protein